MRESPFSGRHNYLYSPIARENPFASPRGVRSLAAAALGPLVAKSKRYKLLPPERTLLYETIAEQFDTWRALRVPARVGAMGRAGGLLPWCDQCDCAGPPVAMKRQCKGGSELVCRCAKHYSERSSDKCGATADELAPTPLERTDRIAALEPPPRITDIAPIKYFDEIRGELGQKVGGDVLWEKIAEAAKRNTERVACFVAGTLVHTKEGLRPIEQIRVGDYVLSKPESGSGETAYKRVVRTIESEAQETWFVSWEDPALLKKLLAEGLSKEDYLAAYGNGFVVTTPNHPFWVVDSDDEWLRYAESHVRLGPPFPKQQWVRADHLAAGMKLLLADGRVVDVVRSIRVYKTTEHAVGWVPHHWNDSHGLLIDFSGHHVVPNIHLQTHRFSASGGTYEALVENPNDSHADDYPPGNAPESWYLSKVYNLEVEDSHTYFVDTMGVWVHNTNCGGYQRLDSVQKV